MSLGQDFGVHNISREGHIGGLLDGSPDLSGITSPTLSLDTTQKAGVPTNANHYSKFMFKHGMTFKADSSNPNGYIARVGIDEVVAGQLIAVTSDTDGRGTVAQMGFNMEFPLPPAKPASGADSGISYLEDMTSYANGMLAATNPSSTFLYDSDGKTLANLHLWIGLPVVGAGQGYVKPVLSPQALDPGEAGDPTDAEFVAFGKMLNRYMKARGQITKVSASARKVMVTLWC